MSKAIENLQTAQKKAMAGRPKVGGFPYLAETLRRAGVSRNIWTLPACQSIYVTDDGPVVTVGPPLISETEDVPAFDREGLIKALRTDQGGTVRFWNFCGRLGEPEWLAMRSTSKRTPLRTSAVTESTMLSRTRQSMLSSREPSPAWARSNLGILAVYSTLEPQTNETGRNQHLWPSCDGP